MMELSTENSRRGIYRFKGRGMCIVNLLLLLHVGRDVCIYLYLYLSRCLGPGECLYSFI